MFGAWIIVHMIRADHMQSKVENLYRRFHRVLRALTLVLHLLRNLPKKSRVKNVIY